MKIIFDYNRTIFDPDTDNLYAGVFDLLKNLSKKHELFLISRNEPGRKNRMMEIGISEFFRKAIFIEMKSKKIFKELVGENELALVVGDSIKDEIRIGNKLGFVTIRVKIGKFSRQISMDKSEVAKHNVYSIVELEKIIKLYE
ncbi:MAG: hypothetical protein ACD_11C00105G0019 [uncultured bacterium]|nr:MAG: hypothetical protein ACD_11C00105G0019 [uncultured bacterium]HBR71371.1 hypothetical protein [Candidatus Moranbacteria bacterium]